MICKSDNFSLNSRTPKTLVPIIPKDTHIMYAIPSGRYFRASARKTALKIYVMIVITEGRNKLNPFEYFIPIAQTISDMPANNSINHFISVYLSLNNMIIRFLLLTHNQQ